MPRSPAVLDRRDRGDGVRVDGGEREQRPGELRHRRRTSRTAARCGGARGPRARPAGGTRDQSRSKPGLVAELAGEGIEQAGPRAEQEVDRRARDAGLAGDLLDLERAERTALEGGPRGAPGSAAGSLRRRRPGALHVSTFVHVDNRYFIGHYCPTSDTVSDESRRSEPWTSSTPDRRPRRWTSRS